MARLGVSSTIYVNVDTPNLGFTHFLGGEGGQLKKPPCILTSCFNFKHILTSFLKLPLFLGVLCCISSPTVATDEKKCKHKYKMYKIKCKKNKIL